MIKHYHKEHKDKLTKSEKVGLYIVSKTWTLQCVCLFFIMVTIPLIRPNTMQVVQYVSSWYLQLILLPLIILGQNAQNKLEETKADINFARDMEMDEKVEKILLSLKKKIDDHIKSE